MIKRSVNIIIAILLIVSTVGIVINKHYSGGKLFSLSVFVEADSCCETQCNCCDEETQYLHLDFDKIFEKQSVSLFNFNYEKLIILVEDIIDKEAGCVNIEKYFHIDIPPADVLTVLSYLQVFRL